MASFLASRGACKPFDVPCQGMWKSGQRHSGLLSAQQHEDTWGSSAPRRQSRTDTGVKQKSGWSAGHSSNTHHHGYTAEHQQRSRDGQEQMSWRGNNTFFKSQAPSPPPSRNEVPAHSAHNNHNNNHGWGRPAYEPRAPPACGSYKADGQQGRCPPNRPLNNMAPQHQRSSNNAWTAPNEQVHSSHPMSRPAPNNQASHRSTASGYPNNERTGYTNNAPASHQGRVRPTPPQQRQWAGPSSAWKPAHHSQVPAPHRGAQQRGYGRPASGPQQWGYGGPQQRDRRNFNDDNHHHGNNRRWTQHEAVRQQMPAVHHMANNPQPQPPAPAPVKVELPPASEAELKLWRPMEKPDTSLTLGYTPLLPSPSQAPAAQRFTLEVAPSGKQLTSDTYEVDFVPCLPATSTTSKPVMGDTAQYAVVPQLAADGSWGLAAVLVGYTWVGASSGEEPLVSASWEVEAAFKEARSMAEVDAMVVVTVLPGGAVKID